MSQKYNSEYVNEQEAFFLGRNDIINRYGNVISHYLMLPGLIGFWPMATVQRSTGNVPNYAPTYTGATKQDMVYNGNPTFNYTATGIPYIDLDGTGDYLSVADNTDLDILGTESWAANPGLTMGCWAWVDTAIGGTSSLMSKDNAAASRAFNLYRTTTGKAIAFITNDGSTPVLIASTSTMTSSSWHFVVNRFVPSTSVDIYLNNEKTTNAVGIPASIFNSTAAFQIGATNSTILLDGRITLAFLCASALSDAIIQSIFQQTRSLFGV